MLGERRSRAGWCADLSEAFKNPDVEETEAATEREQKEEKGRLPENRPCTGKEPGRMKSSDLFFASGESRDFSSVLREVQGYLSKEYSGLVTAGGSDEVKAQIRRFAGKYIQDHRICVAGMGTEELIDAIYSEMAEFGFLTKYVYGEGIEEIDINAWDDVEVQFSGGETRKLEEHFESPEHAVNVVRRMLHVSGMVLDDASPSVLGHLAKNIRIAVLKTPVVDEDVGVAASIRIVNPQNMKKEDFIDGGTATEELLDFLASEPEAENDPFADQPTKTAPELPELTPAQELAGYIRARSAAALITPHALLLEEVENADELLAQMPADPQCTDIVTRAGAKDTYYYSNANMSDNYAMIAQLIEDKDLCVMFAEMVRFNARVYPSATPLKYFQRRRSSSRLGRPCRRTPPMPISRS